MSNVGEGYAATSPEQIVTSFREDLLAGSGYEDLLDIVTINYVKRDPEDFVEITSVPQGFTTINRAPGSLDSSTYIAAGRLLLATNENLLPLRICSVAEIAAFEETLAGRPSRSGLVTRREEQPDTMGRWEAMWMQDEVGLRRQIDRGISDGRLGLGMVTVGMATLSPEDFERYIQAQYGGLGKPVIAIEESSVPLLRAA